MGEALGLQIIDEPAGGGVAGQAGAGIEEVLVPGARICFTGEPMHAGRMWGRSEMEQAASGRGLVPVANVTKTKCDVLVCAEAGTLSRKAQNAAKWGKPVLTSDEFFAWLEGRVAGVSSPRACASVSALIVPLSGETGPRLSSRPR